MSLLEKAAGLIPGAGLLLNPWVLLGLALAFGGTYGLGRWQGGAAMQTQCDADKAGANAEAAEIYAAQLQRATDASIANQGVSIELNTTLHVTRTRTREIVKEVNADVDAHAQDLACIVPDATRRLRNEQVARSTEIAAQDRPVQQ